MLQIVVPMAGAGQRFVDAGYTTPKPFIDVLGRPMIEHVLENLYIPDSRFILITRAEHINAYRPVFERLQEQYEISYVVSHGLTQGQACSVLLAAHEINNEVPLMIANSDQLVDISLATYVEDSASRGLDGSILTFYSEDPKWSFAAIDQQGYVTEIKEKEAISSHATVGIYFFQSGREFVTGAAQMMACGDRTRNEYYVAPVYNYLIAQGKKYGIYEIVESQMHGLGTPDDLKAFLAKQAQAPAKAPA